MLKKFPDKQLYIDTDKITVIDWFKRASLEKYPYSVSVFDGAHSHIVKDFETEEQAEKFSDELAAELNGLKPAESKESKNGLASITDVNGKEYLCAEITALFTVGSSAFAVIDSTPVQIFQSANPWTTEAELEAKRYVEKILKLCPYLIQLGNKDIYFEKGNIENVIIGIDRAVYIVVQGVMIHVKNFTSLDVAKDYCKNLRIDYGL